MNVNQKKYENDCLWMVKGVASIIVILFHCPIEGILGEGIIYALRFPIPIFCKRSMRHRLVSYMNL